MANAVLLKGGGGGTASDELTATAGDVLVGKTAVTKDSNDEPITGTLQTMNGGSWNPGTSVVTVACQNKKMLGNITINPYPNMNGGTYTPSTSRQTISCAGKVMNSNVIIKAVPVMSGGTWTPSKSAITIACAGKRMSGNIVINAIPSGFINVGSGATLINGTTLGPFVNKGLDKLYPSVTNSTVIGASSSGIRYYKGDISRWVRHSELAETGTANGYEGYYFGGYYSGDALNFSGSIDLTPYSNMKMRLSYSTTNSTTFHFYVVPVNNLKFCPFFVKETRKYIVGDGRTEGTFDATFPISDLNGHHFICMTGSHQNGIGGFVISLLQLLV